MDSFDYKWNFYYDGNHGLAGQFCRKEIVLGSLRRELSYHFFSQFRFVQVTQRL